MNLISVTASHRTEANRRVESAPRSGSPGIFSREALAVAAAWLTVLCLADIVLTRHILSLGGSESNTLIADVVLTSWFAVGKVLLPIVAGYGIAMFAKARWLKAALYAAVAIYATVVAWNLLQLILFG